MQFNPCDPCCGPKTGQCHPRACFRFVDGWTGDPISVQVLEIAGGFWPDGQCSVGDQGATGTTLCFDFRDQTDPADCKPLGERTFTLDSQGNPPPVYNSGCSIMANVLWMRDGSHPCSGWVTSPPALCCQFGDPASPVVDWPLCCPEVCIKVSSPPIPEGYGVGLTGATVSDTPGPFMILPGPDVIVGNYICGFPNLICNAPGVPVANAERTFWEWACGQTTGLYTSAPMNGSAFAGSPLFEGQETIKQVLRPYTNFSQTGACGSETHNIWGPCQSVRISPCGYSEIQLTLTDHAGTFLPSCLTGCMDTCTEIPTGTSLNPTGQYLCAIGNVNLPTNLLVTVLDPSGAGTDCPGFHGGTVSYNCASGKWEGCVQFSGPSLKVSTSYPQSSATNPCPDVYTCFDRSLPVQSAHIVVECINGQFTVSWTFFMNDQCKFCKKCVNGTTICEGDPEYDTNVNMFALCSGNVGRPCASWSFSVGPEAGWYVYGPSPFAVCPTCPDCCYSWWDGRCSPACDPGITCPHCVGGTLTGGSVLSVNPLMVEFRGCTTDAQGNVTCGPLQGTITNG